MSGAIPNFAATYGPLAAQAGASLGVDPNIILGQWGLESGYGTNTASQGYNVGSIMSQGQPLSYASPSAFESAYVNTIQSDFPGAVGAGSNALAFANGLGNGAFGSYFGNQSPTSYALGISGAEANLSGSSAAGASTSPVGATSATAAPAGNAGCGILSGGLFTWSCWAGIAADMAFVVLGIGMIFVAVISSGEKTIVTAAKVATEA